MIKEVRVFSYKEWLDILSREIKEKTLYSFEGGLILREPQKIYYSFRIKLDHGKLKYESWNGSLVKEEFMDQVQKYHPEFMEWLLFHPEWTK